MRWSRAGVDDENGTPAAVSASRRRWRRRYGAVLLVPAVALLVWAERRPIVSRFIDGELARAGVPARYGIADLGLGRQRLTGVVIGDPADPDLTADWVETRTEFGLSGPYLAGLSAGNVQIRAALKDGRLSLGAIDRLLPAPSGKPFALPSLPVSVARAEIRLQTPYGPVLLAVAGRGRLSDGFAGPLAAVAPRLSFGGCTVRNMRGAMTVSIDQARPRLVGPIGAAGIACPERGVGIAGAGARLDMVLGPALDRWSGDARISADSASVNGGEAGHLSGTLAIAGNARATEGTVDLAVQSLRTAMGSAARGSLDGVYAIGQRPRLQGQVRLRGVNPAAAWRERLLAMRGTGAGTPVGPLVERLATALAAAARNLSADADLRIGQEGVRLGQMTLTSASGGRAILTAAGEQGIAIGSAGMRVNGRLTTGGGGLPQMQVTLAQATSGGAIRGRAIVNPYDAAAARIALAPVAFAVTPAGRFEVTTRMTLTGPLADGGVEALTMPLVVRGYGRGRVTVNPRCTPVAFRRVAVAGLVVDPASLSLCPTAAALVALDDGRLTGGARLPATTLTGRLGATPLSLTAAGAALRLGRAGFVLDGIATTLGAPGRETRLAADRLTGTIAGGAVAGRFAGATGQIANVPLLMSRGAGEWRLAGGRLSLAAILGVADAQTAAPRFRPLDARQVTFALQDGRIVVGGVLHEPTTGTRIADVAIGHHLSTGRGRADLSVPAITFGTGFQPDLLTPLTFGVIADVNGRIDGAGHIAWSPDGVASTGDFGTAAGTPGIDLAAAFGPAQGIAGRIRFDDLLGLHTPPGQVATVRSVNPGIAVEDGTVRFQLLGGTRVQVEGARWPFAGGALTLDPSLLDFDGARSRQLTFRVIGAQAGQFLQQFDFDNLNATGTFDGVLPMVFDQSGGRIEGGSLRMREGGGTIAYVGALGEEQLGLWGNLAFEALRSLRYRSLALTMDGPLAGEMVTGVRFTGVSQGQGAKSNFLVRRLQRLPFVFNIRIRAPFRGLIDSAASFYDPRRLIQRNLPALLEEQNRRATPPAVPAPTPSIQPPASETVR